jgi:hypothetical protein
MEETYSLSTTLVEQFSSGWLADTRLAAISMRSGDRLETSEIIELAAGAKSLYNTITLLCRQQTRITECAALWKEALGVFEAAAQAWQDVPLDCELLACHRQQLEHLSNLCRDRLTLYQPSSAEWRTFLERRRATVWDGL